MEPETNQIETTSVIRFSDLNEQILDNSLINGHLRSTNEFIMLEILGHGSTSQVFKVRDSKNNQLYAMKLFKKENTFIDEDVYRELTILQSLNHKNIIQLHEIALSPARTSIAIVVDYCHKSLASLIDQYKTDIPIVQTKSIVKQLVAGLRYIHKNHVMHRDLTSSNCVINEEGHLKICDFGSSRRYINYLKGGGLTTRARPQTPGLVTRWYRPPELLFEAPTYGIEVDLWSAGCIIGEILKLKPLFRGESDIQQINLIIDVLGTPSSQIWPGFKDCRIPRTLKLTNQPLNRLQEQFKKHHGTGILEIMTGLLQYNPKKRISADACFEHYWLHQSPFPDKQINLNPKC